MGLIVEPDGYAALAGLTPSKQEPPTCDGPQLISEFHIVHYNESTLVATVNLCVGNAFCIRGIKFARGPSGLSVTMPSRRVDGASNEDAQPDCWRELTERFEEEFLRYLRGQRGRLGGGPSASA